jgi:hypothetical protein
MIPTLMYMAIVAVIAWTRPMVGLFLLILLPQPGIIGMMQESVGLKPWAMQPACLLLGCLVVGRITQDRKSDRFWPIVMLASSGLYVFATNVLLRQDVVKAFGDVSFHGGLLAAFFVSNRANRRLWSTVFAGLLVLLIVSAVTYWLKGVIPFFSTFDGATYAGVGLVGRRAESIYDIAERATRGFGVFLNPNCWGQASALGCVVGLAMVLLTSGRSRVCGGLLFGASVLGLFGAVGRASLLAAIAGIVCLLAGKYFARSKMKRLLMLVVVAGFGVSTVLWLDAIARQDVTFQLGLTEGREYRQDQIRGTVERFEEYWLKGTNVTDPTLVADKPHDIVLAYVVAFGAFPALAAVLAILGGLRATARWIVVGGERMGSELGVPRNLSWAGHLVMPVFIVFVLCGLGNGIAGGTPYRELFLMYVGFAVRIGPRVGAPRLPSLGPLGSQYRVVARGGWG